MPTAKEHFKQGVTLLEEKRYDEAIAEFTKAIELNPQDAEAYYNRAPLCGCRRAT